MPKRRVLLAAAAVCFVANSSYAEGCLGGGQTARGHCGPVTGLSLFTGFEPTKEASLAEWAGASLYQSNRSGWVHMGGVAFRMQRVERLEDRRSLQMIMVPVQN